LKPPVVFSSQITAFAPLPDRIELTGVLLTANALHTQRGHADYLHQRGGHYLLIVKANQCATRRSVTSPLEAGQTRREVCWV
jgi:predicted transposase YbfD/YdcC